MEQSAIQPLVTLSDLLLSANEQVTDSLLSTTLRMETGEVAISTMPNQPGKNFIQNLNLQFSTSNISVPALQKLISIGQSLDSMEAEQGRRELQEIAVEFTEHLPRFAIDNIDVGTEYGSLSLGFSLQGNQNTGTLLTRYLNQPPVTEIDGQAMMQQALSD